MAILRSDLEAEKTPSQSNIPSLLEKLFVYFRDVPKETSRFSKDTAFLHQVSETSNQRISIIETLIQRLK